MKPRSNASLVSSEFLKGITGELHTPLFDVDKNCLKTGVAVMAAAVCDFLDAVQ